MAGERDSIEFRAFAQPGGPVLMYVGDAVYSLSSESADKLHRQLKRAARTSLEWAATGERIGGDDAST